MLTHQMLHRLAPALFTSRRGLPLEIPGPPPGKWLSTGGALFSWGDDSLGHARALFQKYGRVVALVKGGGTRHITPDAACPGTILCFGPEINRAVTTQHELYAKANLSGSLYPGPSPTERQRPLVSFGAGLFSVNGEDHKRHRRLLGPAFSRKKLTGYLQKMSELSAQEVSRWQDGETRDIAVDMRRLTSLIVTATLFGQGEDPRTELASRHLQDALHLLGKPLTKLFSRDLPFLPYRRYVDAAGALEHQMLELLLLRKNEDVETDDMLSALMRARDEESGTALTDQEILGHVSVFFAAGHETTSNGLAWTLLLLTSHPEVLARAVEEVKRVVGERPLNVEDLEQLVYLGWVIKESLRLFTPAPWNGRILTQDTEIGDFTVPSGAEVLFSIYETHRIPEIFAEPQRFLPERWEHLTPSPFEYSPFSAGPRTCIGAAFATMEMKIILATILSRKRLELVPQKIDRFAEMVLAPKSGMVMRVHPADDQHAASQCAFRGNVHDMVDFPAVTRA